MYFFGSADELYKKYTRKCGELTAENFKAALAGEDRYNPKCAPLLKYVATVLSVMQEDLTTAHYEFFNTFVARTQGTVYSASDVNMKVYDYDLIDRFIKTGHTYIEYLNLPKELCSMNAVGYVIEYLKKGYPYSELQDHSYNSLRKLLNVCDLYDYAYMGELYPGKEHFVDAPIIREQRMHVDDRALEEFIRISNTQEEFNLLVLLYVTLRKMGCLNLMEAFKERIHNVEITNDLVERFKSGIGLKVEMYVRALFLLLDGELENLERLNSTAVKIPILADRGYVVVFDGIVQFCFMGIDFAYFAKRLKTYTDRALFSAVHSVGSCNVILLGSYTNQQCNLKKCIPLALEQFVYSDDYLIEKIAFKDGGIVEQVVSLVERLNPEIARVLQARNHEESFLQCFYSYFPLQGNLTDTILQKLRTEVYTNLCVYRYKDYNNPPRLLLKNKTSQTGLTLEGLEDKPMDYVMRLLQYIVKFVGTRYVEISYKDVDDGGYVEIRAY